MYKENKERDQDRTQDALDHFKQWGFVIFPENQKIYEYVAHNLKGDTGLEAGCGNGVGSGIIASGVNLLKYTATDKLERNVKFAKALFPWINFDIWDISQIPYKERFDSVVCVEAIEHIGNYKQAIKNLIASATKEVWISTPIQDKPEYPPSNPYHVREFTRDEFLELIGDYKVDIPFKGLFRIKL